MQIGEFKVYLLDLGSFYVDGGAMFGVVPKVIWSRSYLSDEKNRIKIKMKSLLLISQKRKIIINTGCGNKYPDKIKYYYDFPDSFKLMQSELEKLNISPEEITDVILTHLHFDHCGGNTYLDSNGKIKITFPNAKYYVQKAQLEWAMKPSLRDKDTYFKDNYIPLVENEKIILINGDLNFHPNLSLYKVNGHTYGMQLVGVFDDNNSFLYTSDLIPLASHINFSYIMSYDLLPLISLEEKKLFLEECYSKKVSLILEHDDNSDVIKLGKNEKGYTVEEKYNWNELNEKTN